MIESVLCQKKVRTGRTENGNLFEKESIFVEERKEMEENVWGREMFELCT